MNRRVSKVILPRIVGYGKKRAYDTKYRLRLHLILLKPFDRFIIVLIVVYCLVVWWYIMIYLWYSPDQISYITDITEPPLRKGTSKILLAMTQPIVLVCMCEDDACVRDLVLRHQFDRFCEAFEVPVDVHIQMRFKSNADLSMRNCRNVIVTEDPKFHSLNNDKDMLFKRVERISVVREYHRRSILSYYKDREETPSAMVLFDPDVAEMPVVNSLRNGMAAVISGDWQVVCANGFEFNRKHRRRLYYDVYALLELDDRDRFQEGVDIRGFAHINREEFIFMLADNGYILEVKSCFGGAAIYDYDTYQSPCYYSDPTSDYGICEHRRFHECLREKASARVGIDSQMMVHYHQSNYALFVYYSMGWLMYSRTLLTILGFSTLLLLIFLYKRFGYIFPVYLIACYFVFSWFDTWTMT